MVLAKLKKFLQIAEPAGVRHDYTTRLYRVTWFRLRSPSS